MKVSVYIDDGYTGTSINRPGLRAMLEKAASGEIGCVIVKDFSRFARDHIETGYYAEQIFPRMGVRFISVNDGFDSLRLTEAAPDISFGFVTLLNELYSVDLSQKVKSANKTLARMGKHISGSVPYGYKKSARDKNKLEIDEKAAEIVRRIFNMRNNGFSSSEIAAELNRDGAEAPGQYKSINGVKRKWRYISGEAFWSDRAVNRILRDAHYVGNCVYGKRKRVEVGSSKTAMSAKSEMIIVKGAHDAIVTTVEFEKAGRTFQKRIGREKCQQTKRAAIKLKCGGCGRTLARKQTKNTCYICETPKWQGDSGFHAGKISENEIGNAVLWILNKYISAFSHHETPENSNNKLLNEIKAAEKKIEILKNEKLRFYELYSEGKITRCEYTEKNDGITRIINTLSAKKEELAKMSENPPHSIDGRKERYVHTLEAAAVYIEHINVYTDTRIEVYWSFSEFFNPDF